MKSKKQKIWIGTSGWYYEHWRENFYPLELHKDQWLEYFCKYFDTVELNNTFYHLPKETAVKKWHDQSPADFLFTVKASRYITHIKKLNDVQEPVKTFLDVVSNLKEKLGPVLYQLPPNFNKNTQRLESFIKLLPKKHTNVFEFRNTSWYDDEVFEMLDKHGCALCVHDLGELSTPKIIAGKVIYLRFHGQENTSAGNYSDARLREWADWVKQNIANVKSVYAYFNNDAQGNAVRNAQTLKKLLSRYTFE